jgi:hypothetical protein
MCMALVYESLVRSLQIEKATSLYSDGTGISSLNATCGVIGKPPPSPMRVIFFFFPLPLFVDHSPLSLLRHASSSLLPSRQAAEASEGGVVASVGGATTRSCCYGPSISVALTLLRPPSLSSTAADYCSGLIDCAEMLCRYSKIPGTMALSVHLLSDDCDLRVSAPFDEVALRGDARSGWAFMLAVFSVAVHLFLMMFNFFAAKCPAVSIVTLEAAKLPALAAIALGVAVYNDPGGVAANQLTFVVAFAMLLGEMMWEVVEWVAQPYRITVP